ncbi:MAG: hypothetical protein H7Y17_08785 [Chlorobia bacterium]|nr:hypothetical protein [Fimbriimonadaceae bacterium]
MSRFGVPTLGWLTSALLSLVTLFVFATLQNSGPDSTVQKFHRAALELDRLGASELVSPTFDSSSTQELWMYVANLVASSKSDYQIINYQRRANQAAISVQYRFPSGGTRTLVWIVNRIQGRWKIDTRETALAARFLLSPRQSPSNPLR